MQNPMMRMKNPGASLGISAGGVDPNYVPPRMPAPDNGQMLRQARLTNPNAFPGMGGGMSMASMHPPGAPGAPGAVPGPMGAPPGASGAAGNPGMLAALVALLRQRAPGAMPQQQPQPGAAATPPPF